MRAKGEWLKAKGLRESLSLLRSSPFRFLPFAISLFCFLCLSFSESFAQSYIRVLLVDGKFARIPQKDEKVERVGSSAGEVILNGMKYQGNIEVWRSDKGLYVINEVGLEDYVKGVVAAEEGSQWDIEALKAQAVAARTYALHQRSGNGTAGMPFDLTSSVLHQAYRGNNIPARIAKAVDDTKGQVLMYNGRPIVAYYHSTSGGMTEDPAEVFGKHYPYLKPVETNCELSPFYMWEKRITAADIEKAMNVSGLKDVVIDSYTVSNRVKAFRLVTETGEVEIPGMIFRKNIGWDQLPSTMITSLDRDGNVYVFEGKGYGHGVGMCQWSALGMAKEGKDYREILSFFYPGTTIEVYEDR
ncbi:MAG: SpoIID/LytB domain-containing protein [Nitrospirae bacterium]|nr:SpoIID/LytB domain-containing protein [Nitrospirota bacterium]